MLQSFTRPHLHKRQQTQKLCSLLYTATLSLALLLLPFMFNRTLRIWNRNTLNSPEAHQISTSATPTESRTGHNELPSHIHMLHALQLSTWEFIMFILSSFKICNMQHEVVWKGSRISVGSAADIVKLTHYKWICNPWVDLNCVYCHGPCVCACVLTVFQCRCTAASVSPSQ